MLKGVQQVVPVSVTDTLVNKVAHLLPEVLIKKDGSVDVYKTLFLLGFKIKKNMYDNGISKHENVYVRNPLNPSKVQKKTLYNGQLRNEVSSVEEGNVIKYHSNQEHFLGDAYRMYGTLDYANFDESGWVSILTIGDKKAYDWGLQNLEKAPSKTTRNIVRH